MLELSVGLESCDVRGEIAAGGLRNIVFGTEVCVVVRLLVSTGPAGMLFAYDT